MLAAQSLKSLAEVNIEPKGLVILSGLMLPFEKGNVNCYAIHGYKDARVPINHAQNVAQEMELTLDVIPGLDHEISDRVLEKTAAFCDEVVPVDSMLAGKTRDMEARNSEIHQAKLLRWVTNFAKLATMFDNDYFLSLILEPKMVRLGPECPTIGQFRYYMHDAGPSSRGMVILFHGKIGNILTDTRPLAEAYMKSLKLSVCVIDYRPKFSTFGLDAQVTFEAIEQLSRSTSSPIIVHATGIGAILGIHTAMASQALPTVVQQRFRLLVLDAPVGNMKALPPIPTGCIAVDPIGNDAKLKYVSMPVCLMSGDDKACGIKYYPKHWAAMMGALDVLMKVENPIDATIIDDVALQATSNGVRLHGGLYKATIEALEKQQRSTNKKVATSFLQEIDTADAEEEELMISFQGRETQVKSLMETILRSAKNEQATKRLWEIRAMSEPQRSEELGKLSVEVIQPFLKAMDGFAADGVHGVRQLDIVATNFGREDESLKELQDEIRDALDCRRLDRLAAENQQKYPQLPKLDALHKTMDKAAKYWQSEECFNALKARILEAANGTVTKPLVARVVQDVSAELNFETVKDLILKGNEKALGLSEKEASEQLNYAFAVYNHLDPSLAAKGAKMQVIVTKVIPRLSDELGAVSGRHLAAALADKAATLPSPPPEWTDGADLEMAIYIDREFDLSIPLRAPRGCKARDLKKLLSESADSGGIAADQVFFKAAGQEFTVHDDCLVTDIIKELDLVEAEILPTGYLELSREQAIKMLRELAEGFALPAFQNTLKTAKRKNGADSAEFQVARAQSALEVQKKVIGKYGFKANPIGVKNMMASMSVYNLDPEVQLLNKFINEKFNPA